MTPIHHRGYTLVELIVSVAIFSIVMLVVGAAFLALINLDRQARATGDVTTNLSYVIESMERSIRTGTNYNCGGVGDCWPGGRNSFSFTDAEGRVVSYSLVVTATKGQVYQCVSGACLALTDPRIDVENLIFTARGTTMGDTVQPTVVITVRGIVKPDSRSAPVEFVIESGATQRLIDI
jgi:prepilin-type N-terminal cleavage/methylation domain-containing protein